MTTGTSTPRARAARSTARSPPPPRAGAAMTVGGLAREQHELATCAPRSRPASARNTGIASSATSATSPSACVARCRPSSRTWSARSGGVGAAGRVQADDEDEAEQRAVQWAPAGTPTSGRCRRRDWHAMPIGVTDRPTAPALRPVARRRSGCRRRPRARPLIATLVDAALIDDERDGDERRARRPTRACPASSACSTSEPTRRASTHCAMLKTILSGSLRRTQVRRRAARRRR